MTIKSYWVWFKENWARTGLIVSLFLIVYLVVLVLPQNRLLFALLLATPLYMLHEIDEYVWPGGFEQFMNRNVFKAGPGQELLDGNGVLAINMLVWIALPLFSLWSIKDIHQGTWMPYFFILQALIHLILGIAGKRFLNPGMLTAWLLHVPWAVWTIWLLVQAHLLSNPYLNNDLWEGAKVVLYMLAANLLLRLRRWFKERRARSKGQF